MDNKDIEQFFSDTDASIYGNENLRMPQMDGYQAIIDHFEEHSGPCYLQIPVGCGKSGLIGLTPFGMTSGRVLIVVPNVTIKKTIMSELDISDPNCFYTKRGILSPPLKGPFMSELKTGANIHDCDNAHLVIANIQQFAGESNRWYEKFHPEYFKMILVDEGHHNVAASWMRLFDYFSEAKVVSYTATPLRGDGREVIGRRAYNFGYGQSMMMGYISQIESIYVEPTTISFTAKGKHHTLSLKEVLEMREKDWFSRGIALSEECNRHIVEASIRQLNEVRKHGAPRMIIASACSVKHATDVSALYHEYGLRSEVLYGDMPQEDKDRIENLLRQGAIDVVAQVHMLGEGYDLGTLSVAAVFRPYRSLAPYIQFIGRVIRLADPTVPFSPGNKVYVVSHVGLNDERWWDDFTNFDKEDQEFFAQFLGSEAGGETVIDEEGTPRLTLRPFMRVLNETVENYARKGYLKEVDSAMVDEVLSIIRSRGFDPLEFGLTEEMMKRRLQVANAERQYVPAQQLPVQPQRRKEALRKRLSQDARSMADTVVNRLKIKHMGKDLLRHFPGRGPHNVAILTSLANGWINSAMGIEAGKRDDASIEQFETGIAAVPDLTDSLTAHVKEKLKK
jgi:superfamily II DNA or RNA helicase